MDYDEIPTVDSQLVDEAGGFCAYCGHVIAPAVEPPPEEEPPF